MRSRLSSTGPSAWSRSISQNLYLRKGPQFFWISASLCVCVCACVRVYKPADLSHWRTVISDLASFLARSRRSRYSSSSSVELSVSSSDASWRCCSSRVGLEAARRGVLRTWSMSSSPPALLDLSLASELSSLQRNTRASASKTGAAARVLTGCTSLRKLLIRRDPQRAEERPRPKKLTS